ncbi:MAG: hypothetical protein WDN00_00550 [Limisphaerales bacterium]
MVSRDNDAKCIPEFFLKRLKRNGKAKYYHPSYNADHKTIRTAAKMFPTGVPRMNHPRLPFGSVKKILCRAHLRLRSFLVKTGHDHILIPSFRSTSFIASKITLLRRTGIHSGSLMKKNVGKLGRLGLNKLGESIFSMAFIVQTIGFKILSTLAFTLSSILMSGGPARLKPSPGIFLRRVVVHLAEFLLFFSRIKLSGRPVSSAPVSACQTTRPSLSTSHRFCHAQNLSGVLTRSPG